jgi:hypothetical protein
MSGTSLFYSVCTISGHRLSLPLLKLLFTELGLFTLVYLPISEAEGKLLKKRRASKHLLAGSVIAAHRKLSEYCTKTDGPQGKIHKCAIVFDPAQRLNVYQSLSFRTKHRKEYREDIQKQYD